MDFAKFLETGELSDIVVSVDSKDFKLHKFPLYAHSEYFRALARGNLPESKDGRVNLQDFPGGAETFQLVARHCYNVPVIITDENVVPLRCAAEYLQMKPNSPNSNSPGSGEDSESHKDGSLLTITDIYLDNALTTARVGRKLESVCDVVARCGEIGEMAERALVVEKCICAVVDTWITPAKHIRYNPGETPTVDVDNLQKLSQFPLEWFLQLLNAARSKGVGPELTFTMVQVYISQAIDLQHGKSPNANKSSSRNFTQEVNKSSSTREVNQGREDVRHAPAGKDDDRGDEKRGGSESDIEEILEEMESLGKEAPPVSTYKTSTKSVKPSSISDTSDEDLVQIIDILLREFPTDQLPLLRRAVSPVWVVNTLERIQTMDGTDPSKDFLLRLAAQALSRFKDEDLGRLAPDAFICILDEAGKLNDGKEGAQNIKEDDEVEPSYGKGRRVKDGAQCDTLSGLKRSSLVCEAVDVYLKALCDRDALTADLYHSIVAVVPGGFRISEDTFFQVVGSLLRSDESEKQCLLESIDYSRLSEVALQQAHDSQLVPDRIIARAALALCTKLRSELQASKPASLCGDTGLQQGSTRNPLGPSALGGSAWPKNDDVITDMVESDSEPTTGRGERPPTNVGRDAADVKPFLSSTGSYLPRSTCLIYNDRYNSGTLVGAASSLNGYTKESVPGYLRRVPSLASEVELNMALDSLNSKDTSSKRYTSAWRDEAALIRHRLVARQDLLRDVPTLSASSAYWYSPTPSSVGESATADLDRLYDELEYSLYHAGSTTGGSGGAATFYPTSRYLSNMLPY